MKLKLNEIAVDCIIGDLPEERVRAQRLLVDVTLDMDEAASMTDQLEDTIDYAKLVMVIRRALVEARCRMIERAARLVAEVCRKEPRVKALKVAVTKSGAVPGLGSATAECEL